MRVIRVGRLQVSGAVLLIASGMLARVLAVAIFALLSVSMRSEVVDTAPWA